MKETYLAYKSKNKGFDVRSSEIIHCSKSSAIPIFVKKLTQSINSKFPYHTVRYYTLQICKYESKGLSPLSKLKQCSSFHPKPNKTFNRKKKEQDFHLTPLHILLAN